MIYFFYFPLFVLFSLASSAQATEVMEYTIVKRIVDQVIEYKHVDEMAMSIQTKVSYCLKDGELVRVTRVLDEVPYVEISKRILRGSEEMDPTLLKAEKSAATHALVTYERPDRTVVKVKREQTRKSVYLEAGQETYGFVVKGSKGNKDYYLGTVLRETTESYVNSVRIAQETQDVLALYPCEDSSFTLAPVLSEALRPFFSAPTGRPQVLSQAKYEKARVMHLPA